MYLDGILLGRHTIAFDFPAQRAALHVRMSKRQGEYATLKDFGYTCAFHFIPVRTFRTDKFINNPDFLFMRASVGILLAYINPVDEIIQYFGSKLLDFRITIDNIQKLTNITFFVVYNV